MLTVHLFGMWTHVFDGERLSMVYGFFNAYILPYTVWLLFSTLLLDIYANGIRLQKTLIVAVGVILLAAACANGKNDELIYFFWLIAAYPRKLDLRKAALVLLIAGGVLLANTVVFALANHIASNPIYDAWGVARSVGFVSPGKFAAVATSLIMIWVWWKTRTWRLLDACIAAAVAIIVFVVCHDAVAFLACLLQIILTSLLVHEKVAVGVRRSLDMAVGRCARWGFAALGAVTLVFFVLASPHSEGGTFTTLDAVSNGFLGSCSQATTQLVLPHSITLSLWLQHVRTRIWLPCWHAAWQGSLELRRFLRCLQGEAHVPIAWRRVYTCWCFLFWVIRIRCRFGRS